MSLHTRPKFRFLVDCDNVLGDFAGHAFSYIEDFAGKKHEHADLVDFHFSKCPAIDPEHVRMLHDEWMHDPAFVRTLPPSEAAQKVFADLRKLEGLEILAVTAPYDSVGWVYERDRWLMKHFGFTRKQIIHTDAKYAIRGDLFIDDRPDHVQAWWLEQDHLHAHRLPCEAAAIVWAMPYNATTHLRRSSSWREIYYLIEERMHG